MMPERPPPTDASAPLCAPPSGPPVPAREFAPGSDLLAIAQLLAGGGMVAA